MIPKEKIEEVKERASIVQVISEYVPLTKRGINHVGLCPFHSEKTPSFTVSETKKIFYCFGCNATGNAITFVMKKDGIAFPEAVRSIARRYGISVPEERGGAADTREPLYQALKLAVEYFSRELKESDGRSGKEYLIKRGFDGEIASRFHIGYSPDRWDGLVVFLRKRGVTMEAAEKAGLVVKKKDGTSYYDRFRGRLIFPITDSKGRVTGFGGRALDDTTLPKYLNSPESPVFKKGETLYGFYQARQSISKEGSAIVVEGYFDLLAMHKHGFTNSVATMGTALTPEQIRVLKGYASTVYALFDSDQAGKNAAIRSLNLFLNEEVTCRAVLLAQGKDPDEFLASSGPEAMREAVTRAEPLMEFFLKELKKKFDLTTPEGKRKYLDEATPYLTKVRNIAEKGHYAGVAARVLGLPPESVFSALKMPAGDRAGTSVRTGETRKVLEAGASLAELTVLKVILKFPSLLDEKVEEALEAFKDPDLKKIGAAAASFLKEGRTLDAESLIEGLGDEGLRGLAAGILFKEDDGFMESPGKMLEDSLKRVLNRGKLKETTREMIQRLEDMGISDVASDIRKRTAKTSSEK
ncbi:MAG: DNA primase [Deltaproteobacteria bacterium]|nr:DNA primase [Deltaproteobacteria bacterium]